MFVTFEGTEGSGKSTQIELLAAALRKRGYAVVTTREPGGTALGNALRVVLLDTAMSITAVAEAYLMTAARAELVQTLIAPALAAGEVVLCDRFADSTLAYQGAGRGLPVAELRRLQCLAVGTVWPDLTLLLDVPVALGLARRRGAGGANRIDREGLDFHERVAEWFRSEAARDRERWCVVDGTRPPHVVHTEILNIVVDRLAHRPTCGGGGA